MYVTKDYRIAIEEKYSIDEKLLTLIWTELESFQDIFLEMILKLMS